MSSDLLLNSVDRIRLGLCCINNTLNKQKVPHRKYCNRTCTRKTFTVDKALELALQNVIDLSSILAWNNQYNIKHYRMSSDMFPHFTDSMTAKYQPTPAIIEALQKAGQYALQNEHRITMHPGQFCVVNAINPDVFAKTVEDLSMHAWILDTMGIPANGHGILCIHGGGAYGNKPLSKQRWIEQFQQLPDAVKRRLAIENCEKLYSVRDCLDIAQACHIPMIYDSHHQYCYKILHPDEELELIESMIPEILATWPAGSNPLFHVSSSKGTASNRMICSHHDYIESIPEHMLSIPALYNRNIDIEVEAKAKEYAIFKLYDQYKYLFSFMQYSYMLDHVNHYLKLIEQQNLLKQSHDAEDDDNDADDCC